MYPTIRKNTTNQKICFYCYFSDNISRCYYLFTKVFLLHLIFMNTDKPKNNVKMDKYSIILVTFGKTKIITLNLTNSKFEQ